MSHYFLLVAAYICFIDNDELCLRLLSMVIVVLLKPFQYLCGRKFRTFATGYEFLLSNNNERFDNTRRFYQYFLMSYNLSHEHEQLNRSVKN